MFYWIDRALFALGASPATVLTIMIAVMLLVLAVSVITLLYVVMYFDVVQYHFKVGWTWFKRRYKFGFFRYHRLTKGKINIKY